MTIAATCENQQKAAERVPQLLALPIRHRQIMCEPLLEEIDLTPWLDERIEGVTAGGESGENARLCRYDWVLSLSRQCESAGVPFYFKQTGALFEKDGRLYRIPRREQHEQARRAGLTTARRDEKEEEHET